MNAQNICLDTKQSICHFEIHPNTNQETVLIYISLGCVCLKTACTSVKINNNNVILSTKNHSNLYICSFVKIVKCNFLYVAPVTSHQLTKSNYTIYHKLSPTPIKMNLTLVKQLMKYQDLTKS